jgi:hypothetical protein
MKRMMCWLMALLLCLMIPVQAMAAKDEFVPSISYKDGPAIEDAEMNEEDVGPCLVITSIREAEEKSTDIGQAERDLLLKVYEELLKDKMELPTEDEDLVVLQMVDVSWRESTCVDDDHGHEEWLEEENTTIEIRFDLDVKPGTDVEVYVFVDDEWVPVKTVNNEDGSVTCTFEEICPVIFCIDPDDEVPAPDTGDLAMGDLLIWGVVMLGSGILLVLLLLKRRRENR